MKVSSYSAVDIVLREPQHILQQIVSSHHRDHCLITIVEDIEEMDLLLVKSVPACTCSTDRIPTSTRNPFCRFQFRAT
jgi:hypothetical protein